MAITATFNPRKVAKALRKWYPEDCKLMIAAHWLEDRLQQHPHVKLGIYRLSELRDIGCDVDQ